ncbi:MAG: hypothetical protein K2K57_09140 [Oscillospiraceae bacterium]|nr:hypothetical protein [Oscillospiraceae bacterium]
MKDGICEFIFRKSSNNFFEFSLDILGSIGYSCVNPYFNKIFLWLGDTGDETESSDIAEMHRLLPNEESAALTMWNGTDDIWVEVEMAVSSEFNVLTIDPRLLSLENGQRIIDGIYREISARDHIKNLSRIIIDKS